MAYDSIRANAVFPMTSWSLLGRAGKDPDEVQREALNELLTRYWSALRSYLVLHKRIDTNQAEDLVQGFIQSKILERDLISKAESSRGRFRNLLLTSLDNYVKNQQAQQNAQKRKPDRAASFDAENRDYWAVEKNTPQKAFDVDWARELLAQTVDRMREECVASGRVFESRILDPILEGKDSASYSELVRQYGFQSPSHASNVLISAKRMFARLLRDVISEYAFSEDEVETEIQVLYQSLST